MPLRWPMLLRSVAAKASVSALVVLMGQPQYRDADRQARD